MEAIIRENLANFTVYVNEHETQVDHLLLLTPISRKDHRWPRLGMCQFSGKMFWKNTMAKTKSKMLENMWNFGKVDAQELELSTLCMKKLRYFNRAVMDCIRPLASCPDPTQLSRVWWLTLCFWARCHIVYAFVSMVPVGHLRRSSLSNGITAELERLIGQKGKMA